MGEGRGREERRKGEGGKGEGREREEEEREEEEREGGGVVGVRQYWPGSMSPKEAKGNKDYRSSV